MDKVATDVGTNLWKMVDPLTFRDRLAKPKLLINGTNDRYWTLDALDLYWKDLRGPKYLIEVPNAGHDLNPNRDWATSGLGAFFHHVVTNRPLPQLSWDFAQGGRRRIQRHDPAPKALTPQSSAGSGRPGRRLTGLPRVEVGFRGVESRRVDDLPWSTYRGRPPCALWRSGIPDQRDSVPSHDDVL